MEENDHPHILHFTIGPVQGFVAQARRTRDLWAGSFLLSWLAGQAMASVLINGGSIVFPNVGNQDHPEDPMLAAILNKPYGNDNQYPQIGSLPNRFKATVPADFDSNVIKRHLLEKWTDLCDAVWQEFLESISSKYGNRTREIWDRQINNFWEIQWVTGVDPCDKKADGKWLDIRKNWRNHWPQVEPGDHCVLMHDYQELSGYIRSKNMKSQDQFWQQIRQRQNVGMLDFHEDERLCAIAFVKRIFPKLSKTALKQTIGWIPGGQPEVTGNWPSTVYMAAVPWLEKIIKLNKIELLEKYVNDVLDTVEDKNSIQSERATKIECLSSLGDMANLDGNFFLETALRNPKATPLRKSLLIDDADKENDTINRDILINKLKELNKDISEPASSYYAVLLMDGDKLGKLLGKYEPSDISKALADFTNQVSPIVKKQNGFTIYAGGDDVLALLPINTAINCAIELRDAYSMAYDNNGLKYSETTASTAIIFSHYHIPLRTVLHEAHHQLDDVAKEKNGRDSLAMALIKPSGKNAEWYATWTANKLFPPKEFLDLQCAIKADNFSAGFFYHLRQRYPMIVDFKMENFDELDMKSILIAEYIKSKSNKQNTDHGAEQLSIKERAEQNINLILNSCSHFSRDPDNKSNKIQIGGVLLARFLANGGLRL